MLRWKTFASQTVPFSDARCLAIFFAFALMPLAGAHAADAECTATVVPTTFQEVAVTPRAVTPFGNKIVIVDDAGPQRRLVVCMPTASGAFTLVEAIGLPEGFAVASVSRSGSKLTLTSAGGETREWDFREAAGPESLAPVSNVTLDGLPYASTETEGRVRVAVPRSGGAPGPESAAPSVNIELKPVVPGSEIYTRKLLQADAASGLTVLYWDEVGFGTRAFFGAFDREGRLVKGAQVSLEDQDAVPDHFAGVLADGRLYYLTVKADKATPLVLPWDETFAAKIAPGSLYPDELKRKSLEREKGDADGQKAMREAVAPAPDASVPDYADFQNKVRALESGNSLPEAAAPNVTRAQALECAREYTTFKWILTPASYERTGIANRCNPQAEIWKRPDYLNGKVGQEIVSIPYCWGCSTSIKDFEKRVQAGTHLAGDSCTCRTGNYCILGSATGVDCSGFVSQCWKSRYVTTSSMSEIAREIAFSDLKPGDAFNRAGSHIRLFIAKETTPSGVRIRVIESANGGGSIGRVVESTYEPSALSGYKPIRYNKIVD